MQTLNNIIMPVENPDDYILNSNSYISIIVPEESVNLLYNPEVVDLTGYTYESDENNGSITLSDEKQYIGLNSIHAVLHSEVTNNDRLIIDVPNSLSDTEIYTFSFAALNEAKLKIWFRNELTDSIIGNYKIVKTHGFWHREYLTFKPDQDYTDVSIVIEVLDYIADIYLDAFQLEPKPYMTTFISGNIITENEEVPKPYFWIGVPHKSPSVRLNSTNTGGRPIRLNELGFELVGLEGLGSPEYNHNIEELALSNKSYYQGSSIEPREFTLLGVLKANNKNEFLKNNKDLFKYLAPKSKPLRMQLQLMEDVEPISSVLEFDVIYNGGLEGTYSTFSNIRLSLDFIMVDPYFKSSNTTSVELTTYNDIITSPDPGQNDSPIFTNSNTTGEWSEIAANSGTTFFSEIEETFVGPDNNLYMIGRGHHSVSGNNYILFKYNGATWEPFGPVVSGGKGYSAALGPDNKLYIAGDFSVGGFDLTLMEYDFSSDTYNNIGQTDGPIYSVDVKNNKVVIGGNFTTITLVDTSTIAVDSLAMYDTITETWDTMSGGINMPDGNSNILSVKFDKGSGIWIGGNFNYNGDDQNIIVYNFETGTYIEIDSVTWSSTHNIGNCNADVETWVNDILITNNNQIYIGGKFNSTGSIEDSLPPTGSLERPISVARWNGTTWDNMQMLLGSLSSNHVGIVKTLEYDEVEGLLYVGGYISYAGKQFLGTYDSTVNPYTYNFESNVNGVAIWNGNEWYIIPLEYDVDGTITEVRSITKGGYYNTSTFGNTTNLNNSYTNIFNNMDYGLQPALEKSIFISYIDQNYTYRTITAYSNGITNVPINGSNVKPIITLYGPGEIRWLKNRNGGQIKFNKKLIQKGEIITIDLTGILPKVYSNLYGYLGKLITSSTSLASFVLSEGDNHIELFILPTDDVTMPKAYITYKEQYLTINNIYQ